MVRIIPRLKKMFICGASLVVIATKQWIKEAEGQHGTGHLQRGVEHLAHDDDPHAPAADGVGHLTRGDDVEGVGHVDQKHKVQIGTDEDCCAEQARDGRDGPARDLEHRIEELRSTVPIWFVTNSLASASAPEHE